MCFVKQTTSHDCFSARVTKGTLIVICAQFYAKPYELHKLCLHLTEIVNAKLADTLSKLFASFRDLGVPQTYCRSTLS